jgi:hypothetical protein
MKGDFVSRYKVMVDDNFHSMDEDERYELATFSTIEEAIAARKRIVDDDLSELAKGKNYTPDDLYEHYVSFGSDPFIVALDPKMTDHAFPRGIMPRKGVRFSPDRKQSTGQAESAPNLSRIL